MATVWYLRGPLAGQFGAVDDDAAKALAVDGTAQIFDGVTPLMHPENHPDVRRGAVPPPPGRRAAPEPPDPAPESEDPPRPRRGRPRKYANKVMDTGEN